MKKCFILAALAVLCASCTGESFLEEEISEKETNVQQTFFEREPDWNAFVNSCKNIIEVHKDFENFRDLLDSTQQSFIDGQKFSVDAAVEIIYIWWSTEDTADILIEWPEFDDFIANLPERYFSKYPFCN